MEVQEQVLLAPHTTLKIGGPARFFVHVAKEEDLLLGLAFARQHRLPVFALGGGSNLVVPDAGYPGLVLHLALQDQTSIVPLDRQVQVKASAGQDWDEFVESVCAQGLCGVECLAGIPGLVGGSPVQNIGAYGQEVAASITCVRALDRQTQQFVELPGEACEFGYRQSLFNATAAGRYLVTRVDFTFEREATPNLTYADLTPLRGTNPSPHTVYAAVRTIRERKGMVLHPGVDDPDTRSAGSFFKNPIVPDRTMSEILQRLGLQAEDVPHWPVGPGKVKLAAAWMIEQAGLQRGFALGAAAISTRHTLALTNRTGTATCAELFALRDLIVQKVEERFGVPLEQEPVVLR